jgi:transcriptional regulator with XRE-family HTH domain
MRKKSGMTPTEVSELLGISKEQYLEVEANKRDLKSSDLTDLLLIYGSTPYRFFYDNALVKDGSGMTDVEARKILAKYDLNLTSPDVSQLSPKIRPAVTAIRELIADTRNRLVESGLESQGTIDAFNATYKNYVPLRGFADEQFGSEIIEGGGKLEVRAKERRAKGRKRKADSPLTQAIISNTTTIIRGAKNDVMRKFYELAKNNPNKDIYEVVDPEKSKDYKTSLRDGKVIAVAKSISDYLVDDRMVSVRIDGDYKFIRFKDVQLADTLRGANVTKAQWLTKYLGAFNRFQSALITTYDPGFVFRNFSRDIQTAVLNLYAEQDLDDGLIKDKNIVGKTIADVYPALKTIFAVEGGWTGKKEASRNKDMDQYYKEFLEDGAKTEWFYSKPADQINKDIKKLISGKGDSARKAAASLVERLNSSVENAVRLSAYVNARKAGVSRAKAAELAKNLTVNFNKSGEWGQIGNSLYLFFNASVQGSSRLLRTLKPAYKIDGEGNRKYHLTRAQKMVVGMYIMGNVLSLFNEWMSDDDEDGESFYSKIPDFEKERNIIIMKPNGRDYWKIPLPYGANTFYVAGSYTAEALMGTKTPGEVASAIGQAAVGSFSPINFPTSKDASSYLVKFVTPTIGQIPVSIALNENYFGEKIYRENFPFDPAPKPDSQLGKESGYRWTQAAAKWLNEITGGSEYRSGYIDVNPDNVDFIIESITGGAGKFATRSVNAIDKIMTGNWDQLESRQIPFVRIFNGQPYKYSNITQFYDRAVDVNQKFEEVKAGIIKGADAKKIYEMYKMGKAYKSRMKKISEAEDKAKNIEDPLKQEDILDKLEKERYKLVANFNKRYIQLKIEDI